MNKKAKVTILATLMLTGIITLSACSSNTAEQPNTKAPSSSADNYTAVTQTDISTNTNTNTSTNNVSEITTETTAVENLAVPQIRELMTSVNDKLSTASSFSVKCDLTGEICTDDKMTNWTIINHSFTYDVSDDISYLNSTTTDLNTNETSSYEEFKTLKSNVVTVLTKENGVWVNNTPKQMLRGTITGDAIANFGVIKSLMPISIDTGTLEPATVFAKSTIERNSDGDIVMSAKWSNTGLRDDSHKPFNGLIRTPVIADNLNKIKSANCAGSLVYTFDKDYMLKSVVFDAKDTSADKGYDIICTLNFEWNNVTNLVAPTVTETKQTTNAN